MSSSAKRYKNGRLLRLTGFNQTEFCSGCIVSCTTRTNEILDLANDANAP